MQLKRLLSGAFAALLLLPVPVLGLTFLTPWTVTQSQLRAPATVVRTADGPNGGFLQLDPGAVVARPSAVSRVTATRDFRVNGPAEAVTFAQDLEALLRGADVNVTVQVRRLTGLGGRFDLPPIREGAGSRLFWLPRGPARLARRSTSDTLLLGNGDYNVTVKLTYRKSQSGLWDSTAPSSGSPFTLTLTGL